MNQLYVKNRQQWRDWLSKNHNSSNGIWLVFYKKETRQPTLDYESAVEEALCFGWIDSVIKKLDEFSYARKFTPRKDGSKWSALNKKRVQRMIQQGKMAPAGEAKIRIAKQNGTWDQDDRPNISYSISPEFEAALYKNPQAQANFENLAPSYRKHYIAWINTAKRQETRQKRIKESIELLERGEKLGLK